MRQIKYAADWAVILACVAILLIVAAYAPAAEADGIDVRQSNDLNNQTSGNVITEGSTAWGFSHNLGDVDINEGKNCMGSEAWGTIIVSKQDMRLNQWCAALFYDANRMYRMAAVMRCDIPEIRQHFTDDESCIETNTVGFEVTASPELASLYDKAAQFEAIEDQHSDELQVVLIQQAEIFDRLDEYENKPAPRPQVVQAPEPYTDEQVEAVWAALTGEDDE